MATATEVLAQSSLEGASIVLIYDDVTLVGTGLQFSVPDTSTGSMTVTVSLATGFSGTFTIQPGSFNQVINIPNNRRPTGTLVTTRFGTQTIDWGILNLNMSFNG
jgi:hypothetical protein